MALKSCKVKVPGSLMFMGEHGVLYGNDALVTAINKYLFLQLQTRKDNKIVIQSNIGYHETTLNNLKIIKPWQYILATINYYRQYLKNGFNITINSDFNAIGFGSSAATIVAIIFALNKILEQPLNKNELLKIAIQITRQQGSICSGADMAASIYGKMIHYNSEIGIKNCYDFPLTIIAKYIGYKTATNLVVAKIMHKLIKYPQLFAYIFKQQQQCTNTAIHNIKKQNWQKLGKLSTYHQLLQEILGTSNKDIQINLSMLREKYNTLGEKISGAGLGDCIIGLQNFNSKAITPTSENEFLLKTSSHGIIFI